MGPFKKEVVAEPAQIECPVKPGQRFTYLGVTLVAECEMPGFEYMPRTLYASYVNAKGEIVPIRFVPAEYEAIRAEMSR